MEQYSLEGVRIKKHTTLEELEATLVSKFSLETLGISDMEYNINGVLSVYTIDSNPVVTSVQPDLEFWGLNCKKINTKNLDEVSSKSYYHAGAITIPKPLLDAYGYSCIAVGFSSVNDNISYYFLEEGSEIHSATMNGNNIIKEVVYRNVPS